MSSGSTTSSFALIAFTSTLTLLISHLAVRQDQHIYQPQQPVIPAQAPVHVRQPEAPPPPPPPQPPPPPPPPIHVPPPQVTSYPTLGSPPSPIVFISQNGANLLYMLFLLVLLFGLSGLWLEGRSAQSRESIFKRSCRGRGKKKGYVSSSEEEEEEEEILGRDRGYEMQGFPGSWQRQRDERWETIKEETGVMGKTSKDWKDKMEEKVKNWRLGKGREEEKRETNDRDGIKGAGSLDNNGRQEKKDDCCGCCRILLQKCEEKARQEEQKSNERREQEDEKKKQAEKDAKKKEETEKKGKGKEKEKAVSLEESRESVSVNNSSAKDLATVEKTVITNTTSTVIPSKATTPQVTHTESVETSVNQVIESSTAKEGDQAIATSKGKSSGSKGKGKATAVEEVVEGTEEITSEPPMPMPEVPGQTVQPLPEDPILSRGKDAGTPSKSVSPKSTEGGANASTSKLKDEKGGSVEKGKIDESERSRGKEMRENAEDVSEGEKTGGKISKGLHVLSEMTKDITEEVLKHLLWKIEGGVEPESRESTKKSTEVAVVDSGKDSSDQTNEEGKSSAKGKGKGKGKEVVIEQKEVIESVAGETVDEKAGKTTTNESKESGEGGESPANKGKGKGKKSNDGQVEASAPGTDNATTSNFLNDAEKEKKKKVDAKVAVVENASDSQSDKGKGSGKKDETKSTGPPLQTDSGKGMDSAEVSLLQTLQRRQADSKAMYSGVADYLAREYPSIVERKSTEVNKAIDDGFVSGAKAQYVELKLPWYNYKDEEIDSQPHQDGEPPSAKMSSSEKGKETKGRASTSKRNDEQEAIQRALDLYKLYKDEREGLEQQTKSESSKREKEKSIGKGKEVDAEAVLQTMIEALVRVQQEDEERSNVLRWKKEVKEETAENRRNEEEGETSSTVPLTLSPTRHSTGYPNVIPLEAVNVSSLATVAAINKRFQHPEKILGFQETIKAVASDARKNISVLKEDLEGLREGATTFKARALKGLLKKKSSSGGSEEIKEEKESAEVKKPRKSVRLQDAAGYGEGPRDESRGETVEEARFRRLREMASRLND